MDLDIALIMSTFGEHNQPIPMLSNDNLEEAGVMPVEFAQRIRAELSDPFAACYPIGAALPDSGRKQRPRSKTEAGYKKTPGLDRTSLYSTRGTYGVGVCPAPR